MAGVTSLVSAEAHSGPAPLVFVSAFESEDRSRKTLPKLPIVAVPLIVWLFVWSFWALWGIFVPLLVIVLGRNPRSIWKEIAGFLQYLLRVTAYLSLTVEPFPGYLNHEEYPVSLELEYPERLSRSLALARVVLNPLLAVLGFAIILVTAVVAIAQFFTVLRTASTGRQLRAYQVRLLVFQGRTFAFLLTLTDELPFRRSRPRTPREAAAIS
jgi:Domain of unknown function (DUF4389)